MQEGVIDDEGARRMLRVLTDAGADPKRRAGAAIALGPGLETCDLRMDWDDATVYFAEKTFEEIGRTFHRLYLDASTPKLVRRRILEAAVRAPAEWHAGAIAAAWESGDDEWKLTATFGMGHVPGFEDRLLQVLETDDLSDEMLREALVAAGHREIAAAVPVIARVARDEALETDTRLVAIEALVECGGEEAERTLEALAQGPDRDIAEIAEEAAWELRALHGGGGPEFDDDDLDDEWT